MPVRYASRCISSSRIRHRVAGDAAGVAPGVAAVIVDGSISHNLAAGIGVPGVHPLDEGQHSSLTARFGVSETTASTMIVSGSGWTHDTTTGGHDERHDDDDNHTIPV